MKNLKFTILLLLTFTQFSNGQDYFIPKVGGLENVKDGKDYYIVQMPEKDSVQLYDALLAMVKEKFNGSQDRILETVPGSYIKAEGFSKNALCGQFYDLQTQVEFKIKSNRYIFQFTKFNAESSKGKEPDRLVFQKGSGMLSILTDGKTYLFNKKGKIAIKKSCYNSIIKRLDALGRMFDISDEFEKYASKSSDEDSGW